MDTKQEHSNMVNTLAKDGGAILASMTPNGMHLLHMAVGMSGEAGELMDAIFVQTDVDIKNVLEELGDYQFYFEGLRQGYGMERPDEVAYDQLPESFQENIRNRKFVEMMTRVLAIESSNVLDIIKKVTVYNKENITFETLTPHLDQIDYALYIIAKHFNFTLGDVLHQNIVKLAKGDGKTKPRYEGGNYSDEAANERADKA